jgi:hypothetical protein
MARPARFEPALFGPGQLAGVPRAWETAWAGETPMELKVTTHEEQSRRDRAYWRSRTPEERLDAVEELQ